MAGFDDYPLRGMVDDKQIVEINQMFGYAWDGQDFLEVGDLVVLPSKDGEGEWLGTVTGMGSTWPYDFKKVIRRAEIEDVEAWEAKLEEAAQKKQESGSRAKRKK